MMLLHFDCLLMSAFWALKIECLFFLVVILVHIFLAFGTFFSFECVFNDGQYDNCPYNDNEYDPHNVIHGL